MCLHLCWDYNRHLFFKRKEDRWETNSSVLNASFAAAKWLRSLPPLTPSTQWLRSGWSCPCEPLQRGDTEGLGNRLKGHRLWLLSLSSSGHKELAFSRDRETKGNFNQTKQAGWEYQNAGPCGIFTVLDRSSLHTCNYFTWLLSMFLLKIFLLFKFSWVCWYIVHFFVF